MSKGRVLLDKRLLSQYLLVFFAFFLMVMISNYFAGNIVEKHLRAYGEGVVSASAVTLETYLEAHQVSLEDVAYVVEDMYKRGATVEMISDELFIWNDRLFGIESRDEDIQYIYGVINNSYISGSDRTMADPDVISTHPWYIGAMNNPGEVYYSPDMQNGEWVVSISKTMRDADDEVIGVLAFNILLTEIESFVNNLMLLDKGYGVLIDSQFR
jgi:methyl-accepting chemotaxis protein